MPEQIRFSYERRTGEDRRKVNTEGCYLPGGIEQRSGKERRRKKERRNAWISISPFLMTRLTPRDNEEDDAERTP
jgi:hypothetical protein